ncbi:MAG: PKD domain-containing protein [Chitinophagaceae bacterium]
MRYLIFILSFFSVVNKTCAQQSLELIENKGQWDKSIAYKGNLNNGAIGLTTTGGYKMLLHNTEDLKAVSEYFHPNSNNHQHKKSTQQQELVLRSHMYEVSFLNGNKNPTPMAEKEISGVNNYLLGNDPTKWGRDCKIYTVVTYKNIYPNIDIRYYTGNNHIKYDIVVHPGGNPKNIAMYFNGADDIKVKNGKLEVKTSTNSITEDKPYTFQTSNIGKKTLNCDYIVKGNIVTFSIENYDVSKTLVIDPQLVFSTFSGSTTDNWGFTATYDASGNFYAGGIVFSANATVGFPVSPGAFQTSYGGGTSGTTSGFDAAIIKFSPDGKNRIWATYLGGSSNEQPHSMFVDVNGNLAISGRTRSTNFPTTQPVAGVTGGWDIFITKLNANGNGLIGSRIFAGSGDDGLNVKDKSDGTPDLGSTNRNYGDDARSEILCDAQNNIYLASCTQSSNFFTTNAFQNSNGSFGNPTRQQDGVFIKTNNDLSTIITSTYLGGARDDAAFVLAFHPSNGNIYIAGGTASTDFPGNKAGVYQSSFQGGTCDGFVSILNNDGSTLIGTSYFGTIGIDNIYGIQFDRFGFPYIMGTTTGSWPVQNAIFSQTGGKQFISKLQPNLSGFVYSTIFGTNSPAPNLSPTAFLVDRCENVYVSGWGGSVNTTSGFLNSGTSGLTVTSDAIKSTTDNSDLYFFVLEKNAQKQLYGSFYGQTGGQGGEHVDGGTCRFDKDGIIYQTLCANCGADAPFPTTPGVWSSSNGAINASGGKCNLAAVKIAFNLAGVGSGIQSSIRGVLKDTSGCVPLTVAFFDTLKQGTRYIWNFGDGSADAITTVPNTNHVFNAIGNYRVRLVSIDSSTCNIADTSFLNLRVRNDDATLGLTATKLGDCFSRTFRFDNTSIPPASSVPKPFKPNSFRLFFGDGNNSQLMGTSPINYTYPSFGTYNVKLVLIDTNYCNEPDTFPITIRLIDNVRARFITASSGCAPYTPTINNTSVGGVTYTWQDGQGNSFAGLTPNFTYNTPGTYTIKLYAQDPASCNQIDSTTTTITVNGSPTSAFSFTPNPSTLNATTTFTNNSVGAINYRWYFGDGDSLITNNINEVVKHTYLQTKTYNPCLVSQNTFGCLDTTCQPINAEVSPLFDVPNSFSPNGDGTNDMIFVKGFGIVKMDWKIYNRWGNLVFNSNNIKLGWNGRVNGNIQPQDVYQYTLNIEFADGTKKTKTGDITLLR